MKIQALILACLLLAATGCNDDIFVDSAELPEYTDISIEGDGGQWSAPFSRDHLEKISIDYGANEKEYVTYYDVDGRTTTAACPAADLGSIVFENPIKYYSIGFEGEMMYVDSYYNASLYADNITIYLGYDYGVTKCVHVTFTQGRPLQLVFAQYDGEAVLEEVSRQTVNTTSLANNSSVAQHMEIMPYLLSQCTDVVNPAGNWAKGIVTDMPMLTYSGTQWELAEYKDIRLGETRRFSPSQYFAEKFTVDVPPHTKATVRCALHYTRATQSGTLLFYNSVTDCQAEERFTCTSVYATSFEYTVDYE